MFLPYDYAPPEVNSIRIKLNPIVRIDNGTEDDIDIKVYDSIYSILPLQSRYFYYGSKEDYIELKVLKNNIQVSDIFNIRSNSNLILIKKVNDFYYQPFYMKFSFT